MSVSVIEDQGRAPRLLNEGGRAPNHREGGARTREGTGGSGGGGGSGISVPKGRSHEVVASRWGGETFYHRTAIKPSIDIAEDIPHTLQHFSGCDLVGERCAERAEGLGGEFARFLRRPIFSLRVVDGSSSDQSLLCSRPG